ncbi:hypothetical protein HC248_00553 [Polaromonas vacuolata]|uniref:Uncharacterized protein n=1 Tax=Polaromonas vacuolata TaxID=37448 RepID=A0A6H2H5Z5_9BURK|nr:ligase-associated DNA damage response exonuclease [Polaromonas vacuolata]QJC55275.1 hypothetical protein HC248_00553 [Polaromonas vacuolata]
MQDLVIQRPEGLYCPAGDFYIDPHRKVERAVITHAHADHARTGHAHYLAATPSEGVLRARLGQGVALQSLDYGAQISHHGVRVSLHPAGHVLGSAQVRLEHRGQIWVVSGDYKIAADPTCAAFESQRCDVFITESTFGLPIYRWQPDAQVFAGINAWWAANAAQNRTSVLLCYSFGKAQRILSGVDASIAPIVVHCAVQTLNHAYRAAGVKLPDTHLASGNPSDMNRALVLCPPGAAAGPWLKQFDHPSIAFASGWMLLRGAKKRAGYAQGFVLSDHADWPGLMTAIEASGASRIIVNHGSVPVLVRYLSERGLDAQAFKKEAGERAMHDESGDAAGLGFFDAVSGSDSGAAGDSPEVKA